MEWRTEIEDLRGSGWVGGWVEVKIGWRVEVKIGWRVERVSE